VEKESWLDPELRIVNAMVREIREIEQADPAAGARIMDYLVARFKKPV
jgi:hypothetical protein